MEYPVKKTIHLLAGKYEIPVLICGNVEPGADASTDSQGLPTECSTAPNCYPTLIVVAGNEIISDADEKRAAEMFGFTLEEWNERIEEELLEAFDEMPTAEDYDDDDIF